MSFTNQANKIFNQAIADLIADGTFAELSAKWLE